VLREGLATAAANLNEALAELRELARGLHPQILTTDGLRPALQQLAGRAPVPVSVSAPAERFSDQVESTIYFVCAEALANVAKYAQASAAEVSLERRNGRLVIEITDDGVGGADSAAGSGLSGLRDRVAALDGSLELNSETGVGTTVRAAIPIPAGDGEVQG
jgi:signal transduction histidine kinase